MSLPAPRRPIARLVLVAAVLLLGGVSAARLPVAFLPAWSLPELTVEMRLPDNIELGELTRRWILPLESSIRAVGEVRGMAGEVDASGGSFRVRFRAGTDAERKAARLESELAGLRRRLPAGARLSIWPVGQGAGDESAIVWLDIATGSAVDQRLIEALRELPEVRSLEVAGDPRQELWVSARPSAGVGAGALEEALDHGLRFERLGWARQGGRRLPVRLADQRALPLARHPVRRGSTLVPLKALAEVELRREEAPWVAHLAGERGLVLLVSREVEASPLALERSLRRVFVDFGLEDRIHMLIDEAAPLRRLLSRLLSGLLAALVVTTCVTGWLLGWRLARWQALALPTALSGTLSGLWLAGLALDVTTLPALVVGLACALLFAVLLVGRGLGGGTVSTTARVSGVLAAALVLPIAVSLAGGRLAPLLAAPVRAFVIAVMASVVVLTILPPPRFGELPSRRLTKPLRWSLRNPWTVLLGTTAATYLLFVLSGSALAPRAGRLAPAIGDLAVSLRFAAGGTLAQAEAQIAAVEEHLDEMEEIAEHWSVFSRFRGSLIASVDRRYRRLSRIRPVARRLQLQLGSLGASARVVPLASSGSGDTTASTLSDRLEDRPETDDKSTFYRLILRHTDAKTLQRAHARVMDRLAGLKGGIWYHQIHADWAEPTTRIELVPRPGVSAREATVAAGAVAATASLPPGRALSAVRDLRLRVLDARSPRTLDEVRQRVDLLGLQTSTADRPLVPAAIFEAREVIASPTIKRQSGRFVLPLTVTLSGSIEAGRKSTRAGIDRSLSSLPLPAGTDLERPQLNPTIWSEERRRMAAIAGALPALLFALAACRLSSLGAGLATLAPSVLALAVCAPWVQSAKGHIDEMTLVSLAAALVGCFPLAMEAAAVARDTSTPLAGGVAYRWLARRSVALACVMPAVVVLLAAPGVGLDSDRHPWVLPLRVAAVAVAVATTASFLVLPVLLRTTARPRGSGQQRRGRHRRGRHRQEHRHPPAWSVAASTADASSLDLRARNLSKIYGDGFQALHAVDFRLEPGIVGLLGPNGAGKTTLLRLLCGLLEPTRGQVRFRGVPLSPLNLPEYRRRVGFLPQGFNAYEGFTGADFLDYWAIERGIKDARKRRQEVERVLVQVGLEEVAGRKVRDFSGGMRRRIGIARTLLGEPPIVIVDEPTTGLDVESRNRLRETLLAVAGKRIILFSTHIASDVAAAASRILLLDRGRLIFDGPALDLIAEARGQVFEAAISDHDLQDFSSRYRVTTRVRTLRGLRVRAVVYGDQEPAGELVEPNLEEAYLAMIGAPERGRASLERGDVGSLLDLEAWDSRR